MTPAVAAAHHHKQAGWPSHLIEEIGTLSTGAASSWKMLCHFCFSYTVSYYIYFIFDAPDNTFHST
jgi:hypothetical protein